MLNAFLKYCKKNKRNVIIATLIVAILILLCAKALTYNLRIDKQYYSYEKNESTVGGVWDITEIFQTFRPTHDTISGFGLRFGTFARVCDGNVTVELIYEPTKSSNYEVIFSETFPASSLEDTSFREFHFDPISGMLDHELALRITADGANEKPVTLWTSKTDVYKGGALFINGILTGVDLNIKLFYCNEASFNELLILAFFVFLIFSVIFMAAKKIAFFADKYNKKHVRIGISALLLLLLISSFKVGFENGVRTYSPNFISIGALAILIAITLIFEKHIGMCALIKELSKREFAQYKESVSNIKNAESKGAKAYNVAKIIINLISAISITLAVSLSVVFTLFSIVTIKTIILIFFLSFLAALSFVLRKTIFEGDLKIAALFLAVALFAGLFLSYGMPPSTDYLWDAEIHYGRVIDVKDMLFNSDRSFYDEQMERKHIYNYRSFLNNPEQFINTVISDSETQGTQPGAAVNLYQYVGYIPSAIIIALAELFNTGIFATVTLAKFINIFIYAIVIYFGIKRLKSGQLLFSAIALIPSAIFLASGFTYDHIVTAFIMYAYACFISELQRPDEKVTADTVFKMLAALFIGCGPKMVYFALGIPFIFLGKNKFATKENHRRYVIACVATVAVIFISFMLPFFVNIEGNTDVRGGIGVDSGEQFKFIFTHPFKYATILINFLCEYVSFAEMNDNIINFCYYGVPNSIYGTIGILAILYCVVADTHTEQYVGIKRKIVTWISCVITLAFVATALYIAFTPVAYHTVNGCQYRYAFPIYAPFFYFIGTRKLQCNVNKRASAIGLFAILCTTLFMSIYDIYLEVVIASL